MRVHACILGDSVSHVELFVTSWAVARQALLSMGILQARILECVDMPSSRGSSQPRDQTQVSHTAHPEYTKSESLKFTWKFF